VVPCNWKFPAENFGGDAYHVQWTHLSAITTAFSTGVTANPQSTGSMLSPGNGHMLICVGPDDSSDPPVAAIQDYERVIRPEVERRLGHRSRLINPIVGTVFPHFSFVRGTSRSFRVWQPRGPDKTEIWSWVFCDRAAPAEVKEAVRLTGIRGFSPSGTFEQDDMDNWQECTRTCRGVVSRRLMVNNRMGLGHDHYDERLGAWASQKRISENNHRHFYRRWAELMTAESWADLDRRNAPGEPARA
jgi:phenylpropionate dioxygenase-like ring-hydroxylating dioxygenase large terminal subunit